MNQVGLVGRITKEPVLREVARNRVQTNFVIAVNRNFKNLKGEIEADFILCTLWGKLAENTVRHCGKGSLISVTGRIQSRTYAREDDSRVYVTEIIGESVQFIATKPRTSESLYKNPPILSDSEEEPEKVEAHFHLPKTENEQLPIL